MENRFSCSDIRGTKGIDCIDDSKAQNGKQAHDHPAMRLFPWEVEREKYEKWEVSRVVFIRPV